MDFNWAEMQLYLNANIKTIPLDIPSTSLNSMRKYLPKSFTV